MNIHPSEKGFAALAQHLKEMNRSARKHEVCWCAGCNTHKRANKQWLAGTYFPFKAGQSSAVYFLCDVCFKDPLIREKTSLFAQTFARNYDESIGNQG